ncbi:PorT family protein [Seonamhaeicola algicola]|uniref:PorT family protein n=1 Tax=Seonamhaeicola algicola TaxID=1719036 RepID=A0A5C7AEG2_9FLAO|nr:outer membrane beta-barrel protein [Seonamhaeicola algicola]TXE07018.1 PorT family protein [Seonamhaeicola algicola]
MKFLKKEVLALLVIVISSATCIAQTATGFGLKGGLNYNANGKYFESISNNSKNPDRNIGYHIGVFGKIGEKIYFKPEVVYTSTKSDYNDDDFSMQKLDAPLLVGAKVLGPISVFGGPSFQYILDTEFDGVTIKDVENDFSVGLNFGIGLNFNKVGIDVRYERGFNKNEATFLQNNSINADRLDTRPDQLILSLSIIL